jgi:hypothetical protein
MGKGSDKQGVDEFFLQILDSSKCLIGISKKTKHAFPLPQPVQNRFYNQGIELILTQSNIWE